MIPDLQLRLPLTRTLARASVVVAVLFGAVGSASAATATDPNAMKGLIESANPTKIKKVYNAANHSTSSSLPMGAKDEVVSTTATLLEGSLPSIETVSIAATGTARYQIDTTDWANVRGIKQSFTVGLGHDNWGMDVAFDHPGTDSNWYYGYIDGSSTTPINRCLWIGTPSLDPASNAPTRDCTSTADLQPRDYMSAWNGNTPGVNCGETQCDGTNVTINSAACPSGAPVFANTQPWQGANGTVGDGLYVIPPNATVKWRYMTRDYRAVMMRYTGYRNGVSQDWGFIPAVCLNTPPLVLWVP